MPARAALLLAATAACAGADAATTTTPPPNATAAAAGDAQHGLGLMPGETMAFEVRLAGALVGEAQLAVGELGEVAGRPAIVVRSRAATAGAAALLKQLSDEATTTVDAETGRPITVDTVAVAGARKVVARAEFRGPVAEVTYTRTNGEVTDAAQTMRLALGTAPVFDAHTAMAQLRGWKAPVGAQRTVFVVGGRRLWRVEVTYAGEEAIGSALGNRRAVVFEGRSWRARRDLSSETGKPARTFRVWLSDDADRVPLKVVGKTELGDVVMDLTEYQRP